MSPRQADIWSHLVIISSKDLYTSSWSPKGHCHGHEWPSFVQCQLALLFLRYSSFKIWPWKSKVKVMAQVKPNDCIWCLEFNRYVCFSFRGNRNIFGWDMANFIFDRKLKVKVKAMVKSDGHMQALESNQYVCFSFHGNRTIFGWVISNSIFDLENSRSRSWPSQIWWSHLGPAVQSICLLFVLWQSDHFWHR